MTNYRPPLRDIKFALEHVAELERLTSLPAYEQAEVDVVMAALDEAGRFFAEVVAPINRTGDTVGSVLNDDGSVTTPPGFKDAYEKYVAAGWGAIKGDPEYGGHGFPGVVGTAIQEMMTSASMAFSLCPMLTMSAILALEKHGSEEQRDIYLEKLTSGRWSGTMVLTEPHAGSDLGVLSSRAAPNEDGTWSISGQKIFITWGEHDMVENIVHLVLARAPGAPAGTRGISMFIVPKFLPDAEGNPGHRNNVECVSIEHKLGIHASPTCVLSFAEATGYLVGEVHGGMRYMFTMMNDARLHVGLEGLGLAQRALQKAADFALERKQGRAAGDSSEDSQPIVVHPDVRRMLMTMKSNVEAMRGLMYAASAAIDLAESHPDEAERQTASGRAALLTPVAKAWGTDLGVELTSVGIQVHGGMGYIEETGAAQYWRDSRIAPIYEGTNGIQAVDLVLRKLPLDGGDVVRGYLDEIEAFSSHLAAGDEAAVKLRDALKTGVDTLRTATEYLLARDDPNDALAGAGPYVRMFGIVAGGYYLARLAAAALPLAEDDPWHATKVATATFYADQIMPQAAGLLGAITAGAGPLFAVPPEHLTS